MASAHKRKSVTTPPLSPRLGIYRWRLTMLASISHRASGLVLLLAIPATLWLILTMSHSQQGFNHSLSFLHSTEGSLLLWLIYTSFAYHFFNGIRFLCLDIGFADSRHAMKLSAKIVFILTLGVAALLAVLL